MATRSIVPRADNEGGIGVTAKKWASVWAYLINALTLTAQSVGFTISGGTTSKTLTVIGDIKVNSDTAKRIIEVKVSDDTTVVTIGDNKAIICIPEAFNGMNLISAEAFCTTVSSSGTPTIALRNVTDTTNPLSTNITIDATEYTSYTAAIRSAVNTSYDDFATGDRLAIDVAVAGTGCKGLGVILTFQLP